MIHWTDFTTTVLCAWTPVPLYDLLLEFYCWCSHLLEMEFRSLRLNCVLQFSPSNLPLSWQKLWFAHSSKPWWYYTGYDNWWKRLQDCSAAWLSSLCIIAVFGSVIVPGLYFLTWYQYITDRYTFALQWRHKEHDGVPCHRCVSCLLNRRSNKTSKLGCTGFCGENSSVTGGLPYQRASNTENVYIWWRHHEDNWYNYGWFDLPLLRRWRWSRKLVYIKLLLISF